MIYPIKYYIIVICYTLSFYNYYCIWGNKKYYGGVKSMSEKSCCFCGHRFVFQNINDKVREIITDLVENTENEEDLASFDFSNEIEETNDEENHTDNCHKCNDAAANEVHGRAVQLI